MALTTPSRVLLHPAPLSSDDRTIFFAGERQTIHFLVNKHNSRFHQKQMAGLEPNNSTNLSTDELMNWFAKIQGFFNLPRAHRAPPHLHHYQAPNHSAIEYPLRF